MLDNKSFPSSEWKGIPEQVKRPAGREGTVQFLFSSGNEERRGGPAEGVGMDGAGAAARAARGLHLVKEGWCPPSSQGES